MCVYGYIGVYAYSMYINTPIDLHFYHTPDFGADLTPPVSVL